MRFSEHSLSFLWLLIFNIVCWDKEVQTTADKVCKTSCRFFLSYSCWHFSFIIFVLDLKHMNWSFAGTNDDKVALNRELQTVNVGIVNSSMKRVKFLSFRQRPYSDHCAFAACSAKQISRRIHWHLQNRTGMSREIFDMIHLSAVINRYSSFSNWVTVAHIATSWEVGWKYTSAKLLVLNVNALDASHIFQVVYVDLIL